MAWVWRGLCIRRGLHLEQLVQQQHGLVDDDGV
jgi:hypothetical protein